MLLRRGRRIGDVLVLTITLIATAGALYVILRPTSFPAGGETVAAQTRGGPLDGTDRTFLVKVRQAGLWEIPTGEQAQERAASPRVKEVGRHIAADHRRLDEQVRTVAAQLGVLLPDRPNVDQQRWMTELSGKVGADYDRAFALRLRAAHGKVFALVAQVRAITRNSVIRQFAEHALSVVMSHMTLLESTGLVDYSTLR